jgi:NAD(P)-dependent dehydrogenase (short-subunit alcohol dehydrogenase family)
MTYAQWQHTLRGELDIVFLCTHAAWPWLKASGRAAIVNFASANARGAQRLPGAYCAGKGGVSDAPVGDGRRAIISAPTRSRPA